MCSLPRLTALVMTLRLVMYTDTSRCERLECSFMLVLDMDRCLGSHPINMVKRCVPFFMLKPFDRPKPRQLQTPPLFFPSTTD